jgi:hypothetical protein
MKYNKMSRENQDKPIQIYHVAIVWTFQIINSYILVKKLLDKLLNVKDNIA